MKLKTKLLSFTAAIALSAGMAFAAIDGNALADKYLSEGYTYVEVKVGPTQTKVEAIKGDTKLEVVYDNETGKIIDSENDEVEDDDAGKTGKDVKTVDEDFEDSDENDDETEEGDDENDEGDDDGEGDDQGDDENDGDDEGDDEGDDDTEEDENDDENEDETDTETDDENNG